MAEIEELSTDEQNHLAPYLPPTDFGKASLPFVTLTYAQSMDGMISRAPGVRTQLSGPESKNMTHYLRSKFDAILVGVGTAVADQPTLTCRYPTSKWTPVPVIVDPNGRYSLTSSSKIVKLAQSGQGKVPLIIVNEQLASADDKEAPFDYKKILIKPEHPSTSTLSWTAIFQALKREGLNSVMVEGGARVISQLLGQPDLVHSVIVTTAPKWLGRGGLAPTIEPRAAGLDAASLRDVSSRAYGNDVVLCGRLQV